MHQPHAQDDKRCEEHERKHGDDEQ